MAKKKEKRIPLFNIKTCMGCTMCVDTCPVECLSLSLHRQGKAGHRYPLLFNPAQCIGCEQCMEDCPVEAITMVPVAAPLDRAA